MKRFFFFTGENIEKVVSVSEPFNSHKNNDFAPKNANKFPWTSNKRIKSIEGGVERCEKAILDPKIDDINKHTINRKTTLRYKKDPFKLV